MGGCLHSFPDTIDVSSHCPEIHEGAEVPGDQEYMDIALTPVEAGSEQDIEMFQYTGWPTRKLTPRYFHIFNNRTVTII